MGHAQQEGDVLLFMKIELDWKSSDFFSFLFFEKTREREGNEENPFLSLNSKKVNEKRVLTFKGKYY